MLPDWKVCFVPCCFASTSKSRIMDNGELSELCTEMVTMFTGAYNQDCYQEKLVGLADHPSSISQQGNAWFAHAAGISKCTHGIWMTRSMNPVEYMCVQGVWLCSLPSCMVFQLSVPRGHVGASYTHWPPRKGSPHTRLRIFLTQSLSFIFFKSLLYPGSSKSCLF